MTVSKMARRRRHEIQSAFTVGKGGLPPPGLALKSAGSMNRARVETPRVSLLEPIF